MSSNNTPKNTINPPSMPSYPYQDPEENEINLLDCLVTLLKYKRMIFTLQCSKYLTN